MDDIEEDQGEIERANAGTNTNPLNNIALIDGKKKKKPHNITIKYGNEPKILKNMKYSDKQNYRRYKTKTEPKLHQSIKIDEEDDIIATIKKAFGIENKKNKLNLFKRKNGLCSKHFKPKSNGQNLRF